MNSSIFYCLKEFPIPLDKARFSLELPQNSHILPNISQNNGYKLTVSYAYAPRVIIESRDFYLAKEVRRAHNGYQKDYELIEIDLSQALYLASFEADGLKHHLFLLPLNP